MHRSDAALMRSDDPGVFDEVVRRYGGLVRRVAASFAGDAADDVAQQVFLAAWLHRGAFDARRGSLGTWLGGITRNRAIDALRTERRHGHQRPLDAAAELPCPGDGPAELASKEFEAAAVRRALGRLSPAQRTTLALAYYGDLTQAEIQRRTGHPLGTVKGRMRLGLHALRGELAEAA